MKKLVLLLLALVLIFGCGTKEKQTEIASVQFAELNYADALTKAQQDNKLVLLDFYSNT